MASATPDWTKRLATIKADYELTDDAIGILALSLRFRVDDIQSVAADSITGGGDDKKCDVVYIDKELEIAVIAQCYHAKTAKPAAPANKASDLNTAIGWLLSRKLDELPESLQGRASELRLAIKAGDIKQIYIWYVHNLPPSQNVLSEMKTVETTANIALKQIGADLNVFAEEISKETLDRLYAQAERTIIVTDSFSVRVGDAFEETAPEWSCVVTSVPAKWLYELYIKHKTDLFSANLRGYLGSRASDSNINNGIKSTATEEPENFWVFNNGITALVLDYKITKRSRSGRNIEIEGISIVNGAQTTGSLGSLGEAPSGKIRVPIRFVKANKESIVTKVVRYNNSQNKLQAADFRSTDPIQDRLRVEFEKIPNAEYEGGRRGGASDTIKRSKYTLPSYTVGQSLSAFHGDPVTAYDKKSDIWTNENFYRRVFTERTTARHIVFCYSLLDEINSRRLHLSKKAKESPEALTNAEKNQLEFLNKKGASYLLVHAISMCIETIVDTPIPNKFNLQFSKNVSPDDARKKWSSIVDLTLSLSNQLDSAFSQNRITNEGVKRATPTFLGVVDSLRTIHEKTFKEFAKEVELSK